MVGVTLWDVILKPATEERSTQPVAAADKASVVRNAGRAR